MADVNTEVVSYERHGLDVASGCTHLVQLWISSSAPSTAAPNQDWGMQMLSVDVGAHSRCYFFGVDGIITAANRRRAADFLHPIRIAAAREDAIALIFDDALDQVGGNYFQGFLTVEVCYLDVDEVEELMIETLELGPVQDYSPAPARRDAVEALEKVTITAEDTSCCAVCLDEFSVGCEATKMPCSHVFHGDCIGKWLKIRLDCPLCRFRLPSE